MTIDTKLIEKTHLEVCCGPMTLLELGNKINLYRGMYKESPVIITIRDYEQTPKPWCSIYVPKRVQ